MHVLLVIGIWACIVLAAGSLVVISLFAVRAVFTGKVSLSSVLMLTAPIGLSVIVALVLGDLVRGAIVACGVTLLITLLAVIVSGVRGFWAG